ncbi:MAG: family transposase [Rhodospirillales bacterium]|nr:family transposase [Rhodospirillales bacterium]
MGRAAADDGKCRPHARWAACAARRWRGNAWLLVRITEKPGLTLAVLAAELRQRGVVVAISVVWRFFRAEGISFKKKPPRRRAGPPDVARRRNRWRQRQGRQRQGRLDPARLVFIDETWAKTNMVRTHGRCAVGHRLVDRTAHGHWKTLTFVAALRADRITAPALFDGPINARSFLAYVQQALAKALKPGDLVIMDNLGSHKGQAVRRAIRKAGAKLCFLPPYSPDLNPIEQVFSKLKNTLRTAAKTTVAGVTEAIAATLDAFTPAECANYLQHAGYATSW